MDEYLDRRFQSMVEEWGSVSRPELQKFKEQRTPEIEQNEARLAELKNYESGMQTTLVSLEARLDTLEKELAAERKRKKVRISRSLPRAEKRDHRDAQAGGAPGKGSPQLRAVHVRSLQHAPPGIGAPPVRALRALGVRCLLEGGFVYLQVLCRADKDPLPDGQRINVHYFISCGLFLNLRIVTRQVIAINYIRGWSPG